jgi:hypothetical protein
MGPYERQESVPGKSEERVVRDMEAEMRTSLINLMC